MSRISQILRTIIEKEKLSIRGVAQAVGIDHASLSRSLKDDGNPESRTIEKILDYLGFEIRIVKSRRKTHKTAKKRIIRN